MKENKIIFTGPVGEVKPLQFQLYLMNHRFKPMHLHLI